MVDSKNFLYLPVWVKITSIMILSFCLILSLFIALAFIGQPERSDWILLAMSIAQVAASGLVIALIVFFSERDINIQKLQQKTDEFLEIHMINALKKIELEGTRLSTTVLFEGHSGLFGGVYRITSGDFTMRLWIGLNVRRLIIIYFLPASDSRSIDEMRSIFTGTFSGAEKVGYTVSFELAEFDTETVVSIWPHINFANSILTDPAEKLFWAQDIAMMTMSLARTAIRNNVPLITHNPPGPL